MGKTKARPIHDQSRSKTRQPVAQRSGGNNDGSHFRLRISGNIASPRLVGQKCQIAILHFGKRGRATDCGLRVTVKRRTDGDGK